MIDKGNDRTAVDHQAFALAGLCDIGELMRRNVELFREDRPVARCLRQQIDEVRVFKDILDLIAGQEILDVLSDPRGHAGPLAKALPDLG